MDLLIPNNGRKPFNAHKALVRLAGLAALTSVPAGGAGKLVLVGGWAVAAARAWRGLAAWCAGRLAGCWHDAASGRDQYVLCFGYRGIRHVGFYCTLSSDTPFCVACCIGALADLESLSAMEESSIRRSIRILAGTTCQVVPVGARLFWGGPRTFGVCHCCMHDCVLSECLGQSQCAL